MLVVGDIVAEGVQRCQARADLAGKCVAVPFAPGSDAGVLAALKVQVTAFGGMVKWVAQTISGARLSNKRYQAADSALMAAT